ncbi:MAG: hypothetical protein JNG85_02040 [Spirochaetaceae bacterium]|nr:hypothetical protein [Spirochaetaceae bacterium]
MNYHEGDGHVFTHAGISVDSANLEDLDAHGFRWGFPGFPDEYAGKRTVVHGHWSKHAKKEYGKVLPLVRNKTICIDSSRHDELLLFESPENKPFHVR